MRLFDGKPPLDAVVDEIDDFEGKILLRKLARERGIPLISAADVGDNIMIDIERYDVDKDYPFFHDRIKGVGDINFKKLSEQEKKKLIIKLIGFEKNSERMIDSIFDIGVSIPTWPQLGTSAIMAGGIVAVILKKIIIGEKIKSGRYYVSLDDVFVSDFNSKKNIKTRSSKVSKIKKILM